MSSLLKQLGLVALHAALSWFALAYFSINGIIPAVYFPSGLALAALLLGGKQYVTGVFLGTLAGSFLAGSFLAGSFLAGGTLLVSAIIATANTLGAFSGFWLITRRKRFNLTLASLPDYMRLIVRGAFIPASISAVLGVTTLASVGMLSTQNYSISLLQWWLGETLGIILITPFILVWWPACRAHFNIKWITEAILIFGLATLAGQVIFVGWFHDSLGSVAYGFWVFLFSLWTATRLGTRGTTIIIAIVATQGLFSAYGRVGFLAHDMDNGILDLYASFVLVYALVSTSLATYLSERKQAERALKDKNNLLQVVLDAIPTGVFWKDKDSRYLGCNRNFAQGAGLDSPEDIIGLSDDILPWAAQTEHYRTDDRAVMQSGQSKLHFEETLHLADGRTLYLSTSKVPLRDAEGNVIAVLGAFEDITARKLAQQKLAESENRLRTIIEAEPECIKIVDAQGRLTQMNRAGLCMLQADSLEQVAGNPVLNVIAPEYRRQFTEMHRQVLSGKPMQLEFEIIGLKGERRWVETHATPMQDNGETVQLAITRDITARKLAEKDLRIAAITFESQEGILITDSSNTIIRVNRAFTKITGYTPEDVLGKTPSILKSGRQDAAFYQNMWDAINTTGGWEGEVWNRRKNGAVYPEHLNITAVKDKTGAVTHYVASLVDISLRKAAEEDIRNLAFYDPLTQLPNRRLLLDRLKQALASSARSGKQGALLFIDLDHFKNLNDTLGHDIGDLLLQSVASRLTSCVREGDTVARLGGDEFVVMLEDLSEEPVEAAAYTEAIGDKILTVLNQPYQLGSHKHHNTPSIGATLFSSHQANMDELLKQADIAMYQSKAAGRNTLRFFDPQMQANITARVALEEGLRRALANNEFVLHYQLQTTHDGQAVGAEALIRWQLPHGELMPPSNFIPLAEETGMIVPIGQWVLETACAQLKAWENSPHTQHLQLAVNVSARQFHQADFVERVTTLIQHSAIRPDRLKLELTESLVLDDIEDTIQKMNTLRKTGIHFSMDDFGTGHSSLSSLKKLPLDQLKIDQSFVRDITSDPDDAAIVQTIIAMAKHMDMEIIAEGVETEAQRAFLERHGCPLCQGYLFGKPMPATELHKTLKQG